MLQVGRVGNLKWLLSMRLVLLLMLVPKHLLPVLPTESPPW